MKVEILYPEVANLYGELANITYLKASAPETEVVECALNERPAFLDPAAGVDFVYFGTMSESGQLMALERLRPLRDELMAALEAGLPFLATGNAHELFGTLIQDASGEETPCLGLMPYHAERDMKKRFNSLYIGTYAGSEATGGDGPLEVVGFKSQFTHGYYDGEVDPLFMTTRGPGFNPDVTPEGARWHNFMATYLIGPLFVLNPLFMKCLMAELGLGDITPAFEAAAVEAYERRLAEYHEPNRGFYYH